MSHPPVLAVAIAGVLAVATIAEIYYVALVPTAAIHRDTATKLTPAHQLSPALHAQRVDIKNVGVVPAM